MDDAKWIALFILFAINLGRKLVTSGASMQVASIYPSGFRSGLALQLSASDKILNWKRLVSNRNTWGTANVSKVWLSLWIRCENVCIMNGVPYFKGYYLSPNSFLNFNLSPGFSRGVSTSYNPLSRCLLQWQALRHYATNKWYTRFWRPEVALTRGTITDSHQTTPFCNHIHNCRYMHCAIGCVEIKPPRDLGDVDWGLWRSVVALGVRRSYRKIG